MLAKSRFTNNKKKKLNRCRQRIRLHKILLISSLLLFVLFFGCTGEMTRTEKNLCYSMASKSYAYIPYCETEKSCFEKVTELFKTKLSYAQESELYSLKNEIGRSWFFYNKAITEAKKISEECKSGDYSSLSGSINQASNYIDNSFLELDQAVEKSFSVIAAEEKFLTEQKVDMIKEEPIYDSLVEFRQILSELNNGATNSDSYVSYYLKKADSFNKSNASKLQENLVENTPFWIKNFEYVEGAVLEKLGMTNKGYFPFLSTALRNAIDYFEPRFYTKQGLTALQNFPIFDFMKLYSDLGGNNNSSLKRFSELMNKESKNLEIAQNAAKENLKQLEAEKTACERLLEKNKYNEKYEELSKELSTTVLTSNETSSENFNEKVKLLIKLREEKSKGALPLGEELYKTKELLNSFTEIKKALEWEDKEVTQKLGQACTSKALQIKNSNLSSTNESINKLIQETLYYASKTSSIEGIEKLDYCYEMVINSKTLEEALADYSKLEAAKKETAKECIAYLEKIFKEEEFNELKILFENLKQTEISKENLLTFEENCNLIKQQANNELNYDKELNSFKTDFFELTKIVEELEKINSYNTDSSLEEKINLLKNKIASYAKYFVENELNYSEALPIKDFLKETIKNSLQEAQILSESNIITYARQNTKIIYLNEKIAEINIPFESQTKIIIPNPFHKITSSFYIEIHSTLAQVIEKDPCISEINQKDSNTIILWLECLPYGSTSANFILSEQIYSKEKDYFLFVSNETSLLKRTIELSNNAEVQKILISTKKPLNTEKVIVLANGLETLNFDDNKGRTVFVLEKANSDAKINIFFYISGAITTSTKFISKTEELGKEILEYELVASNNFGEKTTATISILLPVNSFAEKYYVFSEDYTQKNFDIFNDKLVLKNQEFESKQEKKYYIKIYVDSAREYYLEELKKQKDAFILLENDFYSQKTEEIILKGEEATLNELQKAVEENLLRIIALEKEKQEKTSLELMKNTLLEKISELRQQQNELKNLGMDNQAKEIEDALNKALSFGSENENSIAKAFDLITKTIFSTDNSIKEGAEELLDKTNTATKNTENKDLDYLKQDFLSIKQKIDESISYDPATAKKEFIQLNNKFNEIISFKEALDKNSAIEEKKMQAQIQKTYEEITILLNYLEENLVVNEAEIIKAKIVAPITESRLKKLRLMAEEIKNSEDTNENKLEKLSEIQNELQKAFNYLKKQAITSYNSAIDKGKNESLLIKGKELIDSNKYIDALMLLSENNPNQGNLFEKIPFAGFIPVILIVLVAFVLKQKMGKNEKEEDVKRKLILDEWKE